MNLNNLTNKQLENKIKTRRLQISMDDTQAMELIQDILNTESSDNMKVKTISKVIEQRLSNKHESLCCIDEISEVLSSQIWMQNRNK